MTKFQLMNILFAKNGGNIVEIKGERYWLHSVEREDGSGSSFNLKVTQPGKIGQVPFSVYVRTID